MKFYQKMRIFCEKQPCLRLLWNKYASHMLRVSRQLPGPYANKRLKLDWKDTTGGFNASRHRSRVRFPDFLTYFEKPNRIPDQQAGNCVNSHTFLSFGEIIVHLGIFWIIDRTSYRGSNYRTNTIIIVRLATLLPSLPPCTQPWMPVGMGRYPFFNSDPIRYFNF